LTIDGLKFDLRIYAAVTCINPLRIYLFEEGLTRFASETYAPPGCEQEGDGGKSKFVHLTNYSINKYNKGGINMGKSGDEESSGSKWSLRALKKVLRAHGVNETKLFAKIKDIVVKTFISVDAALNQAFD